MRASTSAATESSSAVGSSVTTIDAPDASACATATRCCSPPDSSPGRWSSRCSMLSASAVAITSRSAAATDLDASRRWSATVRCASRLSDGRWKTYPTAAGRRRRRARGRGAPDLDAHHIDGALGRAIESRDEA